MIFEREKTKIDTEFLPLIEEAELYSELYTEDYLKFLATDAYTSNIDLRIGNKIPKGVMGNL